MYCESHLGSFLTNDKRDTTLSSKVFPSTTLSSKALPSTTLSSKALSSTTLSSKALSSTEHWSNRTFV